MSISVDQKANLAIHQVSEASLSFCKFISANETGATGGHQCGYLVPRDVAQKMFHLSCTKGSNDEKRISIHWPEAEIVTESRAVYYGQKSRNESRITRFGRSFPFLDEKMTGSLFVISTTAEPFVYDATVLSDEDSITDFLETFDMNPSDTGKLMDVHGRLDTPIELVIDAFLDKNIKGNEDFPESSLISSWAEMICEERETEYGKSLDAQLVNWLDTEYLMFQEIERKLFLPKILGGFSDMQGFISLALSLLNRRKSRAGKSLEHHLSYLFTMCKLVFEEQVITEDKKKPDFVFPGGHAYHDFSFPADKLIVLGAKTTCKDRWRQVLSEADRVQVKYLCTLQQGNTKDQMKEMKDSGLQLIVPRKYIHYYPMEYQDWIWDITKFVSFVKEKNIGV